MSWREGSVCHTSMRNGFTDLEGTEEPISEHNLLSIKVTLPADCGYGVVDGGSDTRSS